MNLSAADLNRVGIGHAQRRQFTEAAQCFRQAILADPACAISHVNLGNILAELGDFPSAKAAYQQALTLEPSSVDLHFNFGVMLARLNDFAAAAPLFRRAAQLDPNHAAAQSYHAISLAHLDRHAEAIPAFRRAIQLMPHDAMAHSNLANMLAETGDFDAGQRSLEEALRLRPRFPEAHSNYAIALLEVGQLRDSLRHFDAALRLKPDYQTARLLRSVALLLSGDYEQGWREFNCRIKDKSLVPFSHDAPIWDGSPLAGRTLLLEAEQGLGDTIQFVRYAQEIKRHHQCHIGVAVRPALIPLLTGIAGADVLIGQNAPRPPFDVWAPLLSLPGIMRHDPTCFPAPVPYLKADPAGVEKWRLRLAPIEGFKVGIAWQGNKRNTSDRIRSFPLTALAPVAKLPHVCLISLQKSEGSDQLAALTEFNVLNLGTDFDASSGTFMDTAAVMQNLDLVISADTSICHLAGALGVPVWLALAYAPDWRWSMHGDRTPWYPTMRLFRQRQVRDWSSVFVQMANEIADATNIEKADILN